MKPSATLVFVYNSFKDPLFQSIVFRYLEKLAKQNHQKFHLITFEQKEYSFTREQISSKKEELLAIGIYWYPMNYAYGPVLLWNKFKNLVDSLIITRQIYRKYDPRNILSFGNVAAAFGGLLGKVFPMTKIIIQYEPHSEFLVELDRWKRSSLKYKVLHFLEGYATKTADHIMTGTQHMVDALSNRKLKAKLYRTPNAVDPEMFQFNLKQRVALRAELGLQDQDVFIYIGKLGELYYEKELIEVCEAIYEKNTNAHFLIITGYDHCVLEGWFEDYRVPNKAYMLMNPIPHEDVPGYLSCADMGIVAIPPTPSQRYRSPLKTAEYLYCGLPYIVCRGISEDDMYAEEKDVGVVFLRFYEREVSRAYSKIEKYLVEEKTQLRQRCREVGLEYRDGERVENMLKEVLNYL